MLPGLCRVSVWVKPGWYFSPGWSLILIVHSCQLSKPTVAHVSFGVGIFRWENAIFSQSGERVSKFPLECVPTAFQPLPDRVPTAFGTRSECERSVRLFLSSTVYVSKTMCWLCSDIPFPDIEHTLFYLLQTEAGSSPAMEYLAFQNLWDSCRDVNL